MIQDIAPHAYHVDYAPLTVSPDDQVLLFADGRLYVAPDNQFFHYRQVQHLFAPEQMRFLFTIDQQNFFMLKEGDTLLSAQSRAKSSALDELLGLAVLLRQREIRSLDDQVQAFAAYTAWHLQNWYKENRFCGCCASPMEDGIDERKMVCPKCGHLVYPRINPCIIVAVHDGDRLLMTKYAGRSVTWFVLVAGFTEIGESAEDTVRREVMEETGVHVKNIQYFGSQPWGIPGNLILGYTAELDGSDAITIDTNELADAQWIPRAQIDPVHDHLSITSALIEAFQQGRY